MADPPGFRDEVQRLKRLIRDDPEVRARYDLNQDGEIDSQEWDRAVRMLRTELERRGAVARAVGASAKTTTTAGAAETVIRRLEASGPARGTSMLSRRAIMVHQEWEHGETSDWETRNAYTFLEPETGHRLGTAEELDTGALGTLHRQQFLWAKRPLLVQIHDMVRGSWFEMPRPTGWLWPIIRPAVEVRDGERLVGSVEQPLSLLGRQYRIVVNDEPGRPMTVQGRVLRLWTFPILRQGRQVALITKQWSGLIKESFTDADHFLVQFDDSSLPRTRAASCSWPPSRSISTRSRRPRGPGSIAGHAGARSRFDRGSRWPRCGARRGRLRIDRWRVSRVDGCLGSARTSSLTARD